MGVCVNPPENVVVLPTDEKPAIEALERAQGWPGCSDRRTSTRCEEHNRHGIAALFVALGVASDLAETGRYGGRGRRQFLGFIDDRVAGCPDEDVYVALDNLSALAGPNTRARSIPIRTPISSVGAPVPLGYSWMESWFGVLWGYTLRGQVLALLLKSEKPLMSL